MNLTKGLGISPAVEGVGDSHVFEVRHAAWRLDAIFQGRICGSPEDLRPAEEAALPARVAPLMPDVLGVCCRPSAMISIFKIREPDEIDGKHAILSALGSYLGYNKVASSSTRTTSPTDVIRACVTRSRSDTLSDAPSFYRDPRGHLRDPAICPRGRVRVQDRSARGHYRPARMADAMPRQVTACARR